jgi:hypothetical protein
MSRSRQKTLRHYKFRTMKPSSQEEAQRLVLQTGLTLRKILEDPELLF